MVLTYKNKFNMKYGFKKDESHSLAEIARLTGYTLSGLQTIFNKGVGAFRTNRKAVRPQVKSEDQWAFSRLYASINPNSKAHKVDKIHLVK
jgi:hypothetical protein